MIREGIRDWVFDLDNTLYPASSTMYEVIGKRMTAYVMRVTGLDAVEAERLQDRYHLEFGATVVGLARLHDVDPHHFLAEVHQVDAHVVEPDPMLERLLARLPGRKIVFTNGGGGHAERVVSRLGVAHHFEHLFDLEAAGLTPKPQRAAYEQLISKCSIDPVRAVLFEDTMRNLEPAHELGLATVLIGAVHPEPRPAYVDHWAHDLKDFLHALLEAEAAASTDP